MQIKDIIGLLEIQKELKKEKIELKKVNINSSYFLAKNDIRIIENMKDVYETLDYVINILKDCQERVIERNRISIFDL